MSGETSQTPEPEQEGDPIGPPATARTLAARQAAIVAAAEEEAAELIAAAQRDAEQIRSAARCTCGRTDHDVSRAAPGSQDDLADLIDLRDQQPHGSSLEVTDEEELRATLTTVSELVREIAAEMRTLPVAVGTVRAG